MAEGGGGAGLGVTAAGDTGARYFIMAGSTSGVPCEEKQNSVGHGGVQNDACLRIYPYSLRRVDGRQRIQVCHRELDAFPLQFLVNMDHTG